MAKTASNGRHPNDRRTQERRENPYAFNSPEWIAVMSENFMLWPKQDRRKADKAELDRRRLDRRKRLSNARMANLKARVDNPSISSELTDDELQYILNIYQDN
ncbi:hypothetical protein [Methylomonas sp. AM2-LC]|uniref:hypothetical protein n=1 Tax=Methylomonas sp. AM2-LC TaxID=3153301 RepID=UPI0032637284